MLKYFNDFSARSRRPKCTIVIMCCPLSVRRKLFTFSTSSLKPVSGIKQNLTDSKIAIVSTEFVFFGPIGEKMAVPASD